MNRYLLSGRPVYTGIIIGIVIACVVVSACTSAGSSESPGGASSFTSATTTTTLAGYDGRIFSPITGPQHRKNP